MFDAPTQRWARRIFFRYPACWQAILIITRHDRASFPRGTASSRQNISLGKHSCDLKIERFILVPKSQIEFVTRLKHHSVTLPNGAGDDLAGANVSCRSSSPSRTVTRYAPTVATVRPRLPAN